MLGGILLFETRVSNVVGITFTALILTELIMVAVEVKRWHPLMLLAQAAPEKNLVGTVLPVPAAAPHAGAHAAHLLRMHRRAIFA